MYTTLPQISDFYNGGQRKDICIFVESNWIFTYKTMKHVLVSAGMKYKSTKVSPKIVCQSNVKRSVRSGLASEQLKLDNGSTIVLYIQRLSCIKVLIGSQI